MTSEWQPIDTAPKDTMILAFDPNWSEYPSVMMCFDSQWNAHDDAEGYTGQDLNPTHWMPLPEPPVSENEAT